MADQGTFYWPGIVATGEVLSLGPVGSSPNANAATITSNILNLQPASASFPGVVTTGAQSFAGAKTFTGAITASNLSGTNTGDVTLGTANGLSLAGQVLSLQAADGTHTGALTSADWTTFNSKQSALTLGNLTDAGTDGIVITGGTGAVVGSGTSIAQTQSDATHNGYLSSADWTTFNGKQSALTLTNLTDAGTDGITITNGTGAVVGASPVTISQHVADTTHNGYLSSTDWNTFNTSAGGGPYLTVANNLSDVNNKAASLNNIAPTSVAGDLIVYSGTTNTRLAVGTTGQVLTVDTTLLNKIKWATPAAAITALTGDVTASGPGSAAATLATVNGNVGSFTNANITVNAKGLITAASNGSGGGGFTEFFSATSTSTATITNGTVLTFTASDFDTLNGWNGTTTYTAQATGYYKIIGAFEGSSSPFGANQHFDLVATVNGSAVKTISAITIIGAGSGTVEYGAYGEALFHLTANDTVTLVIDASSSLTLTGTASKNYFQVYRVG